MDFFEIEKKTKKTMSQCHRRHLCEGDRRRLNLAEGGTNHEHEGRRTVSNGECWFHYHDASHSPNLYPISGTLERSSHTHNLFSFLTLKMGILYLRINIYSYIPISGLFLPFQAFIHWFSQAEKLAECFSCVALSTTPRSRDHVITPFLQRF